MLNDVPTLKQRLGAVLRDARMIALTSADHGTWGLYERLKCMLQHRCPDLDWQQYEAATAKLATITGV